jgi:hypothetical protein
MSVSAPRSDCHELSFSHAYALAEAGEVALEDYARTLLRAAAAELLHAPDAGVRGVHVCGVAPGPSAAQRADVTAFADSLVAAHSPGLGWS